ncbi:MAG TPA: hypothetical protein VFH54_03580 [Mycobacteriales bacterium]|nr:hypothetical protein [Mycobacteriales bacterium]
MTVDDDLPTSGKAQSCALCGTREVVWVHPLDRQKIAYREYGKGHTLPTFWVTCRECERLVELGDDDELVDRMKMSGGFRPEIDHWSTADVDEVLRKPLAVFRAADLGRKPLPDAAE